MNRLKHFLALALVLLLSSCSREQARRSPDATAEQHIRQVIDTLPADSSLRRTLILGQFGNGIHGPWMDDMRRQGVKEVMFEIQGVWRIVYGFSPQRVTRILYRSKYAGPRAQITDARWLEQIRASGLEQDLQMVALRKAKRAIWLNDQPPMTLIGRHGYTDVYLLDDEWLVDKWLLSDIAIFSPYDTKKAPLYSAALVADESSVSKLLAERHFSQDDLNVALFAAVEYPSDNAFIISLLLKAGANVNAQRWDGSTPLMAAASLYNLSNVRLLLASGANVNVRNGAGDTALSIIEKRISSTSRAPTLDYTTDLIELLKQAAATDSNGNMLNYTIDADPVTVGTTGQR